MENKLTTEKVVDVKDLHISFRTFKGYPHVLNGVNVHVNKKERISIVGETGCGKTTTVNAIAQILARQARIDKGEIYFKGKDVLTMPQKELKRVRAENVSIIFQDPIASLNPVFTIGQQLKEVIRYSGIEGAGDKKVQEEKAISALKETSLPDPGKNNGQLPFPAFGRNETENLHRNVTGDSEGLGNGRRAYHQSGRDHTRSSSQDSETESRRERERVDTDYSLVGRGQRDGRQDIRHVCRQHGRDRFIERDIQRMSTPLYKGPHELHT